MTNSVSARLAFLYFCSMDSATELLVLQYVSFTVTTMMALLLVFTRIHTQHLSRSYEVSRWMLFAALILDALHYQLQIHCGFRAMGDDVGALINILFYSPVLYLISYVTVRMAGIRDKKRTYIYVASFSFLAILTCFMIGWIKYRSLHIQSLLYVTGALFLATQLFFIIYPAAEIRKRRRQFEDETASDINYYNMYMTTGTVLLFTMAVLVPAIIFSTRLLIILGPVFLTVIFFYIVCFVALGFNLANVDEMIEIKEDSIADSSTEKMTPEQIQSVERAMQDFIKGHGYSDQNLNETMTARRLGISKNTFAKYLSEYKGETFRIWLSNIRIEQAKRMLRETNYSNETIAAECGFSSRSWMQQKFKTATGMTPNEWKDLQRK